MAVSWPTGLPTARQGFTMQPWPYTESTTVGAGPPITRRVATGQRRLYKIPMEISGTQLATFETFWTNISQGADTFQWTDPVTDTSCYFRFVTPPVWTQASPGSAALKRYTATLDLEFMGNVP